jgi:hypothetical protein
MASSADSFIDDLLTRRIVKGQMITIPGFADLNESQQAQIIARLQYVPRKASQFAGGTTLTWHFFCAGRQEEREGIIGPGFDQGALEDALSSVLLPLTIYSLY